MDSIAMKERNYKQVQLVRLKNTREAKLLDMTLKGKHGLMENHKFQVAQMDEKQKMLRREFRSLLQATPRLGSELPPDPRRNKRTFMFSANHPQDGYSPVSEPSKRSPRRFGKSPRKHDDRRGSTGNGISVKDLDRGGNAGAAHGTPSIRTARSLPTNLDVGRARENVRRRLSMREKPEQQSAQPNGHGDAATESLSRQSFNSTDEVDGPTLAAQKPALPRIEESGVAGDASAPDARKDNDVTQDASANQTEEHETGGETGNTSARQPRLEQRQAEPETRETEPEAEAFDFQDSIEQAMKARYVRSNNPREFERELSVSEILSSIKKSS